MKNFHIIFIVLFTFPCSLYPQDFSSDYKIAESDYKNGKYNESINRLEQMGTYVKDSTEKAYIFNLLGLNYTELGINKEAEFCYQNALNHLSDNHDNIIYYIITLNNTGILLKKQWKYKAASEYYNKAINLVLSSNLNNKEKSKQLHYLYYNLGIVFYNLKEYTDANIFYKRSLSIKEAYDLYGKDIVYFNLARSYAKIKETDSAEYYFLKAIKLRTIEHGENYFRLASFFMYFGNFLSEEHKFESAYKNLNKAIELYEKNYGLKHPYTANSYRYLGDYYSAKDEYESALYWYQKSLIANSYEFSSKDIINNPKTNDCISSFQLLSSLKYKAAGLYNLARTKTGDEKARCLILSIKTADIAVYLISKLRNEFNYNYSKYIITEEEKTCFSIAVKASMELYNQTNNKYYTERAYMYSSAAKGGVSNSNLYEEKLIGKYTADSLITKKKALEQKISGYNKLVYEERESLHPDTTKIDRWKSELFDLNNSYDSLMKIIKKDIRIPSVEAKNFIGIHEIRQKLPNRTTLVEYFIGNDKITGPDKLYTFIINDTGFSVIQTEPDSLFFQNINKYKEHMSSNYLNDTDLDEYNRFNTLLNELFNVLFRDVTQYTDDKSFIIIPDEETAFISFDALLQKYDKQNSINYSGLPYLIKQYCFSYAYSAKHNFREKKSIHSDYVYAFAPEYPDKNKIYGKMQLNDLESTNEEISGILKLFKGKEYAGNKALKDSFINIMNKGRIIHLAGHAYNAEDNGEYSFIAFTGNNSESDTSGALLYAYEAENSDIISPLIVLSACNTGKGDIYSGEGVMSIASGFLKAGASSVVHSLWNVKDNPGSKIMIRFYEELAKGNTKNEALRTAKLEYMRESWPTYNNPAYWAGYILTGDISPVLKNTRSIYYYIIGFLLIISGVSVYFRLSKRSFIQFFKKL